MKQATSVLIKLSGSFMRNKEHAISRHNLDDFAKQIKTLRATHRFGIVIGGGNLFQGNKQGVSDQIEPNTAHGIGLLATTINALFVLDILKQNDIPTCLLTARPMIDIGQPITIQAITKAKQNNECIIFAGGTGNPFFTTDTAAVLRALQMKSSLIWKATNVDGVYTQDPAIDKNAIKLDSLNFDQALKNNLGIMDATAFAMAKAHNVTIHVFNAFAKNAFIKAGQDPSFVTVIKK